MNKILQILLFIVGFLPVKRVLSFPEMIRHGYTNCLSCHASPVGGGGLTLYGREMSKELLSTWSTEKEHQPLHGLLDQNKFPSWLYSVGGDVRGLQFHFEDQSIRRGDWLWMQVEAEIGLKMKSIHMNASVAKFEKEGSDEYVLRKAYLMVALGKESYLRLGQFKTNYGLNIANHDSMIKKDLGLEARSESYSAEYSWVGERWNYVASATLPKQDLAKKNDEKKYTQQLSYNLSKNYKLGVNYSAVHSKHSEKQLYGVHSLLGFSRSVYALVEADVVENALARGGVTKGAAFYSKLGYELVKGLHVNASGEFYQADLKSNKTSKKSLGLGIQWFPRPHFEFQLVWNKLNIAALGNSWSDAAYFLFHYYL